MEVAKIARQVFWTKSFGNDTGGELTVHGVLQRQYLASPWHRNLFYQMVKFFSTTVIVRGHVDAQLSKDIP